MRGDSGYAYLPAGQAEVEFAKYEKRIRELVADIDRMRPVVQACQRWRHGWERRKSSAAYQISVAMAKEVDTYEATKAGDTHA